MPRAALDLADDLLGEYLDLSYWLEDFQRRVVASAGSIQNMQRWQALKFATPVRQRLGRLEKSTQAYYKDQFDKIYLAGAHTVDPTFRIPKSPLSPHRRALAQLNLNEYSNLKHAINTTGNDTERFLNMVWQDSVFRRDRYGFTFRHIGKENTDVTLRHRGIRANSATNARRYEFGNYTTMVIRQHANRAYNMGIIHAAEKKGIKYLVVSDGPECGWTAHDDGQSAAGMIVTLDEAAAYPEAHPNCQRSFAPATDDQVKNGRRTQKVQNKQSAARRAARLGLLTTGGVVAGLQASNYLGFGVDSLVKRFAGSQLLEDTISQMMQRALRGDPQVARLVQRLNKFRAEWAPAKFNTEASVFPIYPGGGTPNIPLWDEVRAYADGFLNGGLHMNEIPSKVKAALGATEDKLVEQMGLRFQYYYKAAKDFALAEDNVDNIFRVLEFERQRRKMFDFFLKNIPGTPEFKLNWTPYGNRMKVNLTNWLNFGSTLTRTGPVSGITAKALDNTLRGVVRVYQDGLVGGHISAIPKNFLNGVFRAIIEIDEDGRLVGNVRLVPGGPLRVTMEFAQKSFKDTIPSDADLLQASGLFERYSSWPASVQDKALKDLRYLWQIRNHQLPLNVADMGISPAGFIANVAERFKDFEFKQLRMDLRVFNQSVFDISGTLRIPVADAVETMKGLIKEGIIKESTAEALRTGSGVIQIPQGIKRYTGTFRYLVKNPDRAKEILGVGRATLFGNIRFSSLTNEATQNSFILKTLKNLNVRILTKAKLESRELQTIATNMKIHGWTLYDIANVLEVRVDQVKFLVDNGLYRLRTIMEDFHVLRPEDISKVFDARLWQAQVKGRRLPVEGAAPGTRYTGPLSPSQAVKEALRALDEKNPTGVRSQMLMDLAGVRTGDPPYYVYNRLRNVVEFMREQAQLQIFSNEEVSADLLDALTNLPTDAAMKAWSQRISQVGEWKRTLHVAGGSGEGKTINQLLTDANGNRVYSIVDKMFDILRGKGFSDYEIQDEIIGRKAPRLFKNSTQTNEVFYETYHPDHHRLDWQNYRGMRILHDDSIDYGPFSVYVEEAASRQGIDVLSGDPDVLDSFFSEMDFMKQRFPSITEHPPLKILFDGETPLYSPSGGFFATPAMPIDGDQNEAWMMWHHWNDFWDYAHHDLQSSQISYNINTWIHEDSHFLTHYILDNHPESLQRLATMLSDEFNLPHFDVMPEWKRAVEQNLPASVQRNVLWTTFDVEPFQWILGGNKLGHVMGNVTNSILERLLSELGTYSDQDMWEFIAEAETQFLTRPDDLITPIARVVGQWMDETLNPDLTFHYERIDQYHARINAAKAALDSRLQ